MNQFGRRDSGGYTGLLGTVKLVGRFRQLSKRLESTLAGEQRHRLADLLEQVLNGTVHPIDALKQAEKWQDVPSNRNDVNLALNTLMQFHIHQDVRSKDSEYDEDFRHSLRLRISELRR